MNDITFIEYQQIDLSDTMLIVAFPTVGLISSIAGHFIIDTLKLESAGAIMSDRFMPAAVIHKSIPHPPVRIYVGKKKCGPNHVCTKLAIIISEFMPPYDITKPLVDKILQWAHEKNCKFIVSIEGMHLAQGKKPHLYGVASTPEMKEILKKYNIEEIKEGMITGDSGVFLYQGALQKQHVICLLAEAQASYPDSRAAGMLLEKLDVMLPDIKIDPEPLYKQADEIEKQIRAFMQQSKPTAPSVPPIPHSMYG
ncbi:MAG: PAC2 family protein [Candidatus Thermoplasmatota archaeon]